MESAKVFRYKASLLMLAVVMSISLVSMMPQARGPVSVESGIWTTVASAAIVDEGSLSRFMTSAGHIRFKGTSTGTIQARINVANPSDSGDSWWNDLTVVYTDPDGSGNAYKIYARLYRVKIRGTSLGSYSTVATFNSNNYAATTGPPAQRSVFFNHDWDFFNYAYYIYISLYRSNTSQNPALYSLQLMYWIP